MASSSVDNDLDVEITAEDQRNICRFSCLSSRNGNNEAALASLSAELEKLADAEEEVTLVFGDDEIQLKIGQSFVACSQEDVQEFIMTEKSEKMQQVDDLKREIEKNNEELSTLKAVLYAKFGQRINLEK